MPPRRAQWKPGLKGSCGARRLVGTPQDLYREGEEGGVRQMVNHLDVGLHDRMDSTKRSYGRSYRLSAMALLTSSTSSAGVFDGPEGP
jgi:hypothetical protein